MDLHARNADHLKTGHGREHIFLGSTAERVLTMAHVPC